MPKISVIMPVYNGEKYVENAIQSLMTQSCKDWELIVINDGSTDGTARILDKYTADARVKVVRQENSGEACARNAGLDHATGEYIAFLDADDDYLPNGLEHLSLFLDAQPECDVVYSDGLICDSDDNLIMHLSDVRPGFYSGNILEQVVVSSSVITVPVCTMLRRATVIESAARFDRNLTIGPDWDFWIQLAVHARFGYLDKHTCRYRVHTTNITRTTNSERRKKDGLYLRMKIMNAEWFGRLSFETRQWFFFDLLTNVLAGDLNRQRQILESQQFSGIDYFKRADFWRLVAIDALSSGSGLQEVRYLLEQSYKSNPKDRKTRSLLWTLGLGRLPARILVHLWHLKLAVGKKTSSTHDSRTERLQKLMGVK